MAYHQWQVVLARLDPIEGSEQGGTRPVLVVSNDEFNENIPNVTVIPLSATPRPQLYPAEVMLPAGSTGKGGKECRAMAHQIRTISQQRIERELGELSDVALQTKVIDAILDHLGHELTS